MTLAVIPARKGSKGLPNKNIKLLNGKPLLFHTIDAALECPFFDKVMVTTDSEEILNMCNDMCGTHLRNEWLGLDDTPLAPVIFDALETAESRYQHMYNTIVTLQPTSPLRTSKHIIEACAQFERTKADSLLSVVEETHSLWGINNGEVEELYNPKVNRQTAIPYYLGNGAIFITKRDTLLKHENRLGDKIALYIMDARSSLDIHTLEDLELAEWHLKR